MSKINSTRQALNKASSLLAQKEYQTRDDLSTITRIFLAQALVLELRDGYGLNYEQIGAGVGVSGKTIRYNWLDANDCPMFENIIALAKFYEKTRLSHV